MNEQVELILRVEKNMALHHPFLLKMTGKDSVKIVAIVNKNTYEHPDPKFSHLPKHEFATLFIAPPAQGKTNLICNLLTNHYKGYFHDIHVVSTTVNDDPKWDVVQATRHLLVENKKIKDYDNEAPSKYKERDMPIVVFESEGLRRRDASAFTREEKKFNGKIPQENFYGDINILLERMNQKEKQIERIAIDHGKDKAKEVTDRSLVVLDDQVGNFKGGNTRNPFLNFITRHRHYNASIILVTQAFRAIPKAIRTCFLSQIMFHIPNESELNALYEELPYDMGKNEWLEKYRAATDAKHGFLYLNANNPIGKQVYKNFETLLVPERHRQLMDANASTHDADRSSSKIKK